MSRARESAHAWVVADDVGQAADDLRRDWSVRRTPTWALDTGLPEDANAIRELGPALPVSDRARLVAIALAQMKTSRDAVKGLERPGLRAELSEAQAALGRAEQELEDLKGGTGTYAATEVGRAVSDLARARAALTKAKWTAEHSPRWRERRTANKKVTGGAAHLADSEGRWESYVAPEVARLQAAIDAARQDVDRLVASREREVARSVRLAERGHIARRAAGQFAAGLVVYREALDEGKSPTLSRERRPPRPAPWLPPGHHEPSAGRDFGPGL